MAAASETPTSRSSAPAAPGRAPATALRPRRPPRGHARPRPLPRPTRSRPTCSAPAASPSSSGSGRSSGSWRSARRRCRRRSGRSPGSSCAAATAPIDGIDYALCVRRPGLDAALVETALEAGAEVRERARVVDLIRERRPGRRGSLRRRDGAEHELRAKLVVGADGRRCTVAELVGAAAPYRVERRTGAPASSPTATIRAAGWRETAAQWREGRELGDRVPLRRRPRPRRC